MCMIFILIQIKFNIDIKNDELLENLWEHKKRKKKKKSWLLLAVCNICKAQIWALEGLPHSIILFFFFFLMGKTIHLYKFWTLNAKKEKKVLEWQ